MPVHVRVHEILGRQAPPSRCAQEAPPIRRAIDRQLGEIAGGSRFAAHESYDEGPATRAVFRHDGPVFGELESHHAGWLALHGNRVHDHADRTPSPTGPVASQAGSAARAHLLDVDVLLVHADHREAEAYPLVVAGGDPGKRGLAGAGHVPTPPGGVSEVAQRRQAERAMGIVREQRLSGRRTGPAYDPVVRPFDPAIAHVPVGLGYGTESDALEVEPGAWIERAVGIRGPERGHALSAH